MISFKRPFNLINICIGSIFVCTILSCGPGKGNQLISYVGKEQPLLCYSVAGINESQVLLNKIHERLSKWNDLTSDKNSDYSLLIRHCLDKECLSRESKNIDCDISIFVQITSVSFMGTPKNKRKSDEYNCNGELSAYKSIEYIAEASGNYVVFSSATGAVIDSGSLTGSHSETKSGETRCVGTGNIDQYISPIDLMQEKENCFSYISNDFYSDILGFLNR